eukprot:g2533.t1
MSFSSSGGSGSGSGSSSSSSSGTDSSGSSRSGSGSDSSDVEEEPAPSSAAFSVLPPRYHAPAGFSARRDAAAVAQGAVAQPLLDTDAVSERELWLFRLPATLDPSLLSGAHLTLPRGAGGSSADGDGVVASFPVGNARRCMIRPAAGVDAAATTALLWSKSNDCLVTAPPFAQQLDVVAPLAAAGSASAGAGAADAAAPMASRFSCYSHVPQKSGLRVRCPWRTTAPAVAGAAAGRKRGRAAAGVDGGTSTGSPPSSPAQKKKKSKKNGKKKKKKA